MLQDCEHQSKHPTKVFALGCQFNRRTTQRLQGQLLRAVEMGCHHVILDFSDVLEVDSTSLRELSLWYDELQPRHVQISIVNPTLYVRTRLDWENLVEVIPIYATEEDALGYVTCP